MCRRRSGEAGKSMLNKIIKRFSNSELTAVVVIKERGTILHFSIGFYGYLLCSCVE